MCGIAGFVDFTKNSSEMHLANMATCIKHRGPDGQGLFFKNNVRASVGLAHRRLAIIDLSASANQPMHFDGLHIVFNGEIYNYTEIRQELIAMGHEFKTHSDTEVILHSWRQWGEKGIQKWHGMFAICLYDEKEQELICIRDRAGVKPFFYFWNNDLLLFGSELKSIREHPLFPRQIDVHSIASCLQYGYISFPYCIYKETYKLDPGNLLRINLNNRQTKKIKYWDVYDFYNKPKLKIDIREAIKETESILSKAFQYRMVADVPVGVFLSGGYDSSCVTALLQKNNSERIKTFTIGTTDNKLNEAPFAKQIAQHLGTDHTELYCTSQEALEIIDELPYYFDEPFADSSAIPTILVSRLARKKVTVALSADAGDEIFAGYNRYDYIARYRDKINAIPRPMRKIMVSFMENVSSAHIPYLRKQRHFHSRYEKLKNLLKDPSITELSKNLNQVFSFKEIRSLFNQDVSELKTAHTSNELKNEFYDPLSLMMAVDYQTYMIDDILQKVDRATMSVSLEGREPFLDQSIIEWAAQLPSDYKYRNGEKKYILKQIVHKYIPKEIMDRPKMGFSIPVESWLTQELKDKVQEYLSESNIIEHNLFNYKEVKNIIDAFYMGRSEYYLKVWYLLMFQMWYTKWM